MDCPHKIPPSRTPAPTIRDTEVIITGPIQGATVKTMEDETNPHPSKDTAGITAQAAIDLTEITQSQKDGTEATATEAVQGNPTQQTWDTITGYAMTHCISNIADHPHPHSSFGYQSQDHSRSHLQPSYKFSRYESNRSGSYSSRTRRRPHS